MGIFSFITDALKKRKEAEEARKAAIVAEREKWRARAFNLRNGTLPEPMQPDGRIILENGEQVYMRITGISYLEERTSRVNYGGGGASFHVAKGVTIRSGGGTAVPVRQLQIVDSGSIYITNKKVVFIGGRKNIVFPTKKIVACSYGPKELHIASSTKITPIIVTAKNLYPEVWECADATIKALVARAI